LINAAQIIQIENTQADTFFETDLIHKEKTA